MVVEIGKVLTDSYAAQWEIRRMVTVLKNQGQIEPLQVREQQNGDYLTFHQDPWGAALVCAARVLRWPTLLVVVMKKYEE